MKSYYMKTNHEKWFRDILNLADNKAKNDKPRFLKRITSGKELAQILSGAYGTRRDYEDDNF